MLTVDDVLRIHARVAQDAQGTHDPIGRMNGTSISPMIKDRRLLESAIGRQHAGLGNDLFYPTPESNAASLMFGLAMNHAFHDGNKRTALVAFLNHLDRNHLTLEGMNWKEVESVVLDLVLGVLSNRPKLRQVVSKAADRHEAQLLALAEWVRQNSRRIERGERRMTYNQLERVLKSHGFEFENPEGNFISIVKVNQIRTRTFFGREKMELRRQNIGTIGYPGGKREIAVVGLKQVRRICRLTEEFGVDSAAFYDENQALDDILNRYRKVLRSLADK